MKLIGKKQVLKTHPFTVEEMQLAHADDREFAHPYHRLLVPDWVNVLPLTSDGHAVLIKQPRAGVLKEILEIPGGVIDPGETDPTLTARRELEEETGYSSDRILYLGSQYANPAIMNNRCHFFLAHNSYVVPERRHFPDPEENIQIALVPVGELEGLVRSGRIDHSLSALCILLASKYLPTK